MAEAVPGHDADQALLLALAALRESDGSLQGTETAVVSSIAWSLLGLLATRVEPGHAGPAHEGGRPHAPQSAPY